MDSFVAALVLAATAANDALVASAALDPALRARVSATLSELETARAKGREAALAALLAASAPRPSEGVALAPPRARAVLSALVPRELGSAWMRGAAPPRVGFRASPALRATLLATEDDAWRE